LPNEATHVHNPQPKLKRKGLRSLIGDVTFDQGQVQPREEAVSIVWLRYFTRSLSFFEEKTGANPNYRPKHVTLLPRKTLPDVKRPGPLINN